MYLNVVLLPGQCFRMLCYDSFLLAPGVSNGKHRRNLMSLGAPAPSGSHICSHKHTGSAIAKVRKGVFSLLGPAIKGPEKPASMASKTGLSLAEAEMESKNGYVMPCSHQTNLYHHPDSGSNGKIFRVGNSVEVEAITETPKACQSWLLETGWLIRTFRGHLCDMGQR